MKIINKLLGRESGPEPTFTDRPLKTSPKLVAELPRGMVRQPDHVTSMAAAAVAERSGDPLRMQVLRFAKDAGPGGFIDEDTRSIDPARPESSLRKRRAELAEKNWIVEAGYTRRNSHGQESKVWIHRDFDGCPPPLVSVPKKRKLSASRAVAEEREAVIRYLDRPSLRFFAGRTLADHIREGRHRQ